MIMTGKNSSTRKNYPIADLSLTTSTQAGLGSNTDLHNYRPGIYKLYK